MLIWSSPDRVTGLCFSFLANNSFSFLQVDWQTTKVISLDSSVFKKSPIGQSTTLTVGPQRNWMPCVEGHPASNPSWWSWSDSIQLHDTFVTGCGWKQSGTIKKSSFPALLGLKGWREDWNSWERSISHCYTGQKLHTVKTLLNNANVAINVADKSLF